jgi:hypothetical protein
LISFPAASALSAVILSFNTLASRENRLAAAPSPRRHASAARARHALRACPNRKAADRASMYASLTTAPVGNVGRSVGGRSLIRGLGRGCGAIGGVLPPAGIALGGNARLAAGAKRLPPTLIVGKFPCTIGFLTALAKRLREGSKAVRWPRAP